MPDIDLVRPFSVPVAVAKARVQRTADELAAEYRLRSKWQGDTLCFDGTGLHGEIQVSGSEIRLEAHLSLLLRPLRAKLVSRIEDKFGRLFPEAARKNRRTKEV